MPSGTADEVIFGSPELSDSFWTPDFLGKQVGALHLSDAHEDEEEERAQQRQTTTASHLPSATAFPSEQDLDTEGSDLLNLISTSLDRFNAQLHRTEEGTDLQQLSQQSVQQQHQPPNDCGIPIPVAYSQVSAHINPLSENFSNSVMRAWATASDCPPCRISPNSLLSALASSSSSQNAAGTAQLFSEESVAAPTAAATFSKNAKILPSPPGLPRLPTANHLFEIASTSSTNDSNSTRSHLDAAAAAVATVERRRSPNTCSPLSETPLWDSQWGQFPAEPCVQSTDSGFDSEHAFAWWSSPSQPASEQSDLQRGCGGGGCSSGDDPHGSLDCGFNRAGGSSSADSGLPCFNGHPLDDQLLMQEVKAVVAAAAAAAAAVGTFKSPLDVPNPTNTSPALRSALWASWPLSSTDGGGGISSSSVSSCCFFDSNQRQQVDHTASHSSPGMPSGMSSLARYETANELLQQQQQQSSPSFQLTARRKAASLSSASTGPPRGLFPTNLSSCGGPRSPSGGGMVGQLGSPPSQPRQHHNNHHSRQQQQSYEMQHARHNPKAMGPSSQKLGSKSRDQASRINLFSAKPLSASLGSNCTSLDDGGYFSPGGLKTGGVGGHPRKGVAKIIAAVAGVSEGGANNSDGGKPVIAKWRRACSFYLRGHCKKEDCEFAHDLTKVTCKFWELGECFKGSTCPFLHGYPPELLDGSNASAIPSLLSVGHTTTSSSSTRGTPVS